MVFFITQCPNCKTSFNTRITQLHAADGVVRCGACLTVFEADENLLHEEELQQADALKQAEREAAHTDNTKELDAGSFSPDNKHHSMASQPISELAQGQDTPKAGAWDSEDFVGTTVDSDDQSTQKIVDSSILSSDSAISDAQPAAIKAVEAEQEAAEEKDNILLDLNFLSGEQPLQNDNSEYREPPKIDPFVESDSHDDSLISDHPAHEIAWHLVEEFDDLSQQSDEKNLHGGDEENPESNPDIDTVSTGILNEKAEHETIRSQLHNEDLSEKSALEDLSHENLAAIQQISDPLLIDWHKGKINYWKTFLYGSLGLIFSATLVLQYLFTNFDTLSQTALWRPWYESACSIIGCKVRYPSDVGAITSDSLMIRSHSTREDALVVNIIFHNEASFSQPYPAMNLSFSDINNQPIASRVFLPTEYLHRESQFINLMQPQSPIQVSLEIMDPGSVAVNYEVSFHEI